MTTESRHQAEEMQTLLSEMDSTERELRARLDARRDDYAPLFERMRDLNAHIRVRAETLARAVLVETAPTLVAVSSGACGVEHLEGDACDLRAGHDGDHEDSISERRWP